MGRDKARAGCTKQGEQQEVGRRYLLLGRRWNSACAAPAVPLLVQRQEGYPQEFSPHVVTTAVMESSKTQVLRVTFFPILFF